MSFEDRKNKVLKQIHDAIVSFDETACAGLCKQALEEKIHPGEAITLGLAAGMKTVGELYEKGEYFVPELLLCSDTLYIGLEILQPHLEKEAAGKAGKIVIGVVQGDVHDIGKNLVKGMLVATGWDVCDLGRDVSNEKFIETVNEIRPDIVGLSALMTTSMMVMKELTQSVHDKFPGTKVMVGGAPLTPEIAGKFGADGFAPDLTTAVREAERLLLC